MKPYATIISSKIRGNVEVSSDLNKSDGITPESFTRDF